MGKDLKVMSNMEICGKKVLVRGNIKCDCFEVGGNLICLRNFRGFVEVD